MLTKCTVQEAKFPVKISSDSVAWRDLILALKGYDLIPMICVQNKLSFMCDTVLLSSNQY
jgi:hypothetical protein